MTIIQYRRNIIRFIYTINVFDFNLPIEGHSDVISVRVFPTVSTTNFEQLLKL